MKDKSSVIARGKVGNDNSWCEIKNSASKELVRVSDKPNTIDRKSNAGPHFTEVIRRLFYGEQREPEDDTSQRDEEPDRIEAHRSFMERPRSLVKENHYALSKRSEGSMNHLANQILDDDEIIKRYLSPETGSDNSAMLFLAGTLFSSNQYTFELLNESGFFNPKSQKVVNGLASEFVTRSKQLVKVLMQAERSSGAAMKNLVVSCVNNFVSTSNRLSKALEQEVNAKDAAIGSVKEASASASVSVLNDIIAKRNQISNSLYSFFMRIVKSEKSEVSTSGNPIQFLTDAKKFSNYLFTGMNAENFAYGKGIEGIANDSNDCVTEQGIETELRLRNSQDATNSTTNTERDLLSTVDTIDTDTSVTGMSVLSSASSFLDFINMSSLSLMFDEDEKETQDADVPKDDIDAILDRMNLSIPTEEEKSVTSALTGPTHSNESPPNQKPSPPKLSAKEKRKNMIITRTQARQGKKKKKARAKESDKDPSKNKNSAYYECRELRRGKLGVLLEI